MVFKSALLNATRNLFGTGSYHEGTNARRLISATAVIKEPITKHLDLFRSASVANAPTVQQDDANKPLVVILGWLLAKPQHLKKYSDLYIARGYNVLTVSMSPWQFIWPTTGAQLVADELLGYLKMGPPSQPLIVHGLSVGAYLWGECLVKLNSDLVSYASLINRVKGQIWDSAPDISELHKGFPKAIAPNNAILRRAAEKYFAYHLKTFHEAATQHYIRSSQLFHTTPIKAPSLIFVCKNDPIASYVSNKKVQEYWNSVGIKTYFKCWEKSKHVSHLILYREEYIATLDDFLASLDVHQDYRQLRGKIAAKL